MSKGRGPEVEYHCSYDCSIGGCPGHKIVEIFDRSTDIYIYEIDGKPEFYFGDEQLRALIKAHELSKGM